MTAAGWPSAGGEVDDAPRGEQVQAAVAEVVLLDERQHVARRSRPTARSVVEVDLDVEVAGVGEHGAVLHALEVLAAQHVARAGDGDEDVAALRRLQRRHHLEALHPRLERAQRVDLADDDLGARAARALRHAAPGPAVAEHDERLAGEQQVRGAQDPVERRLAGAVAVVEDALGARLVDRDDRAGEPPRGLQRADAQQPRGRLLGAAEQPLARARPASCSSMSRSAPSSSVTCGRAAATAPTCATYASASSPRRAWTSAPCSATSAAATSSWVDSGLAAHSATSRPAGDERAHEVRRLGRDVQARGHRDAVERALAARSARGSSAGRASGRRPTRCEPGPPRRGRESGDVGGASSGSGRACRAPRPARRCRRPAPA